MFPAPTRCLPVAGHADTRRRASSRHPDGL